MANTSELTAGTVTLAVPDGLAHIEQGTPLTRLHYFDGKFLRADALTLEQDYHRNLVRLANLSGGWGVVHGLGISLAGDQLSVSPGLAITPAGSTVLAGQAFTATVNSLLKVARPAPAAGHAAFAECSGHDQPEVKERAATGVYEITVGPVEGLCGNEAVYGKLCEDACVTDSQRPYWREGLVLRLRPITLALPGSSAVALTHTHLRNRVASAYFASEPWLAGSLLSASGLAGQVWCQPAQLYGRDEVPIGLLVREGGSTRVIDAWSVRRERMDSQARGYWQGRMMMRPWNVFLAQILQFQCQLSGAFSPGSDVLDTLDDDCRRLRSLLKDSQRELEAVRRKYELGNQKILQMLGEEAASKYADALKVLNTPYQNLKVLGKKLSDADETLPALPQSRMLLNAGFVQLPPAGYLPVVPGRAGIAAQLARMFGEGVRLHFHGVRADEIPHLLEQAQHMERISLTRGLDDPKAPEAVEIFVPDGEVVDARARATGTWWQVEMLSGAYFALGMVFRDMRAEVKPADEELRRELYRMNTAGADTTGAAPAPTLHLMREEGSAPTGGTLRINADTAETGTASPEILENAAYDRYRTNLERISQAVMHGLARTEARADGSCGLTLVAALDAVNQPGMTNGDDGSATPGGALRSNTLETYSMQLPERERAFYLAGDIAADPFSLAIGNEAALKAEMRNLSGRRPAVMAFDGALTVLAQHTPASGMSARLVQLDMLSTRTLYGLVEGPQSRTEKVSARFYILRKGNAGSGLFVVDDEQHDARTPPLCFDWDDSPRRAAMFVQADSAQEAVLRHMMKLVKHGAGLMEEAAVPGAGTAEFTTATRRELLRMHALPAMPEATGTDGAAALNAILAIADATDDAAFLARARRRLFPALEISQPQEVRAIHDWVMFRRARTPLCGPCAPAAQSGVEAFQIWHLKVDDEKQLGLLQAALEQGDAKALASLRFQRVGILRYRDAGAYSEESAARVQAMWRQVQPGGEVVLGRIWESAPATGQGWQNHFRLRNMLEQIAVLTQPPARGDAALAAIPAPPPPLADGALDGGMLVVTRAALALQPHRVLMMPYAAYQGVLAALKKEPGQGWQDLQATITRYGTALLDLNLRFSAGQLEAASLQKLQQGDQQFLSPHTEFGYTLNTLRIDADPIGSGVNPAAQHQAIVDRIGNSSPQGKPVSKTDDGAVKVARADLGGGAQVLTLAAYLAQEIN